MKKKIGSLIYMAAVAAFCIGGFSAESSAFDGLTNENLIKIVKAEDELRFDKTLHDLLLDKDQETRARAALAAGRIGDKSAVSHLAPLLESDSEEVARMAVFALGEIESMDAASLILGVLIKNQLPNAVRARAIEAAGKLVAAEPKSESAPGLMEVILDVLEMEDGRGEKQDREVILLGITAVIRAKPNEGDYVLSKFLTHTDSRIRSDSANAIGRLRSKRFTKLFESMLKADKDPVARANAARALGSADGAGSVDLLLVSASDDKDLRVRVGAISSLGRLKANSAAEKLLKRGKSLFDEYMKSEKEEPVEINELLSIAGALGNILESSNNQRAVKFLEAIRYARGHRDPEIEIALVRISPTKYKEHALVNTSDWRGRSAIAGALGFTAELEKSKEADELKQMAVETLRASLLAIRSGKEKPDMSYPVILRAYSRHKTADLSGFLRDALKNDDSVVRGTAAGLLGEIEIDKQEPLSNYFALRDAYRRSETDRLTEGSMGALNGIKDQYLKLKEDTTIKIDLLEPIKSAAQSPDYLIRRKAHEVAKEVGLNLADEKKSVSFEEKGNSRVKRVDYERAVSRTKASAVLTTTKGKLTIEFFPQAAPLTVENFISLAKSGYFNGLAIHRVVPNFVVQDGDPRGDGEGGPGWHIRCEINQNSYERGTVGMALAGKDTGGSQWFVAHSPQPHLDGGYTVFGKVNETDMQIVDKLARGDVIQKIEIIE